MWFVFQESTSGDSEFMNQFSLMSMGQPQQVATNHDTNAVNTLQQPITVSIPLSGTTYTYMTQPAGSQMCMVPPQVPTANPATMGVYPSQHTPMQYRSQQPPVYYSQQPMALANQPQPVPQPSQPITGKTSEFISYDYWKSVHLNLLSLEGYGASGSGGGYVPSAAAEPVPAASPPYYSMPSSHASYQPQIVPSSVKSTNHMISSSPVQYCYTPQVNSHIVQGVRPSYTPKNSWSVKN